MRQSEALKHPSARKQIRSSRQELARQSKSFSWAARLFDRQTADDVAILYHFCRLVDDIADHQTVLSARNRLALFQADLDYGDSEQPEVRALIEMAQRRRMDLKLPSLLVDAVRADTGAVRLASERELLRYAYGVASTVGLMMCSVMGVRDPAARVPQLSPQARAATRNRRTVRSSPNRRATSTAGRAKTRSSSV